MPLSSPEEARTLRRRILEDLEGYEGDTAQLSCNIPAVVNEALKQFAEEFSSPKITKSHIVQWALVEFVKQHRLTPQN